MSKTDTSGDCPAFPVIAGQQVYSSGMTLRDWFASRCPLSIQEAWSVWSGSETYTFGTCFRREDERNGFLPWYADIRYEYADSMLHAREQGDQTDG